MTAEAKSWVFNLKDKNLGIHRKLMEGISARVFPGDQSMLSIVEVDPFTNGTSHSHPEEQWGILLEGHCIRIQGDEKVSMQAGDFWHTPANVSHAVQTFEDKAFILDVFSPPRRDYTQASEGYDDQK